MEYKYEICYDLKIIKPGKDLGKKFIETIDKIIEENFEELYAINEMFKEMQKENLNGRRNCKSSRCR